jgi:hypothetical protein
VIGNPPYIRIQTMKEWAPLEVEIYKELYESASTGNYDIYVVFVEKGLGLLKPQGRLGFILPHKFFNAHYGEGLRSLIAAGNYLEKVVHFGDQQVFAGATTYTCLLFLEKAALPECEFVKVDNLSEWRITGEALEGVIPAQNILAAEWNFVVGEGAALFDKLSKISLKLGDVAEIFVGLQTSADDVFILDFIEEKSDSITLRSKSLDTNWIFEKGLLFPLASGADVIRYSFPIKRQYILFPYDVTSNKAELIDFSIIINKYPKTANYFLNNKKQLEEREKGKAKGNSWYGYIYLKNMTKQQIPKLCIPRLVTRLYAAYDSDGINYLDNVDVGGVTIKPSCRDMGFKYLLGLINSKLIDWYFQLISANFRGGWMSANRQFISQLPIRLINFN